MKSREIKYVAYARKSTDQEEKQITSIEDQLKEIERIGKDCKIFETLTEKDQPKLSEDQFLQKC